MNGNGIASLIRAIAYLAALILVVWLVLDLLDATGGNDVERWFHHAADWLATWTRPMFTSVHNTKVRALLVFGIPAVVYAGVGNAMSYGRGRTAD